MRVYHLPKQDCKKHIKNKMDKKQLETKLKEKEEARSKLYYENISLNKNIAELEQENKNITLKRDNILTECNRRADFIKQILMIVSGEAESNSKYQVIRDMFLEQIKEIESMRNPPIYNQHINFLSENINEDGRSW